MRKRQGSTRTESADVRAIKRLAAAWRAAWLAGDADVLVSMYTDKPVLMPQGRPPIFGKKAILAIYRSWLREVEIRSTGKLKEVGVSGDLAYFWSTYNLTAIPKQSGERVRSKGKSLFVLKRDAEGTWKIARLIDNSDAG